MCKTCVRKKKKYHVNDVQNLNSGSGWNAENKGRKAHRGGAGRWGGVLGTRSPALHKLLADLYSHRALEIEEIKKCPQESKLSAKNQMLQNKPAQSWRRGKDLDMKKANIGNCPAQLRFSPLEAKGHIKLPLPIPIDQRWNKQISSKAEHSDITPYLCHIRNCVPVSTFEGKLSSTYPSEDLFWCVTGSVCKGSVPIRKKRGKKPAKNYVKDKQERKKERRERTGSRKGETHSGRNMDTLWRNVLKTFFKEKKLGL